jgi:hypothetical protein
VVVLIRNVTVTVSVTAVPFWFSAFAANTQSIMLMRMKMAILVLIITPPIFVKMMLVILFQTIFSNPTIVYLKFSFICIWYLSQEKLKRYR